ncbi:iron export ABC transporter permease subunit FetB [Marinobacter nanhaiticus D15-8W]|uniref:Iron export ABC transporter permease subunit FetB n=1 Tax=Marinobacter nanhaiticus D15-8W TaxID=626887 RepID=N6WWQ6_9GAMM|nr:iron export ABC transporter permease subunit FetB [Marinobacter nanhaiticus]ENO13223.1 iron export ABC transporter permease subunit FetB [Marinobacter nanhaiticus D15-8W]BES70584.1 iron export ABC transporter permease subunit FetB [Marinobacter nanhaiticus D15-8W]
MDVIDIAWWKLALASGLVLLLAAFTYFGHLGMTRSLLVAALRTVIQLALIGLVLEALFANAGVLWVILLAIVMLLVAGREVMARQNRRLTGAWAFGLGTGAMFVSSFTVTIFLLTVIIGPNPWYAPQYAIPLLGMILGNAMTGIALSLDRLTEAVWRQQSVIESRLMLGQTWREAVGDIRRDAMRSGLIPSINAMAAAGIVSLPGMMTGQILAGSPPGVAVKYQILVMFAINVGAGFGSVIAVNLGSRRLFDERERLRLDRLEKRSGT